MNARNRTRIAAVTLLTSLVAGVVVATTTLSPAKAPSTSSHVPVAHVQAPMVGVPTGEMENGVPVYRLPSITVAVSRSAALAEMAREEQLASK
jgi:hypothetical protein